MYKKVLLAVDLNHEESWRKALPAALAVCEEFGANLSVITAIPDLHMRLIAGHFPVDFVPKLIAETEAHLQKFVEQNVKGVESTHKVVSGGKTYKLLLEYADENNIDLIVLEAYNPDLKDYLLGSNADKIVRHAKQSVLVVRE